MGFFGKIKQWLGIGTVKVELKVDPQVQKAAGELKGQLVLTAKSDQHVSAMKVKLVEHWTTGRGEQKRTKTFELGDAALAGDFDMKAGEAKTIDFSLPFQLLKSKNDELKDRGGALGTLGKLGSFMDAEKSEWQVQANVELKGTGLGPSASRPIHLA